MNEDSASVASQQETSTTSQPLQQHSSQQNHPTIHNQTPPSIQHTIGRLPKLINEQNVYQMINLQVTAIDRLETTNEALRNCNIFAQKKLIQTSKLFKKTAKQMIEAKRDLDYVYRKICELKSRIREDNLNQYPNPLTQPSRASNVPTNSPGANPLVDGQ